MTIKLYDENAYETYFSAKVISCKATEKEGIFDLIVDKTLFFPEEGGQTPDKGEITSGDKKGNVLDVQIKDEVIHHFVDTSFEEGSEVSGVIDFKHRYSNMQQHTGEHIFSGIVNRKKGYDNVGFHLSDSVVTMDYSGPLTEDELSEIELLVNRAIYENRDVIARYPDKEELDKLDYRSKKELKGAIRIVTVEGYDVCACCAPHVRKTGEIGILKIISAQNYKGGTRVSILCGERALNFLKSEHDLLNNTALKLSTSWDNIPAVIKKQQDEIAELKMALGKASGKLLEIELSKVPLDKKNVLLFADDNADPNVIRRVVNKAVSERDGYCSIFWGNDADGYKFIIGIKEGNCSDLLKDMREHFEVRGGGKPLMVQGSASCKRGELEEYYERV